jgi:hypothetical protein
LREQGLREEGDGVRVRVGKMMRTIGSTIDGCKSLGYLGQHGLLCLLVGLYPIVKRIGKVAYKFELPPELAGVHPVFHVSQLQKCVVVETRVPAQALDVQETLEYLEYPVQILDWAEKSTRSTTTRFCKVLWSNHSEREAMWEKESVMREKHPHLFKPEVTF